MHILSEDTFKFMAELKKNNNKQWFDANRSRYEECVRKPMKSLAESLTAPVSEIFPDFSGKAKISRINNDIRFTPNKPPYKEHMWISFIGSGGGNAELFAGISENGWSAGCAIHGKKRDDLEEWRLNLIENATNWRAYLKAIKFEKNAAVYMENHYKKPLYPDIPEDLVELVQAKGLWIVSNGSTKLSANPEAKVFSGLCKILPLFYFMHHDRHNLPDRLRDLGVSIHAPDKAVEKAWLVFSN